MQIDEHYKLILWTVFSSVQQTQPKLSQLSCQHRWKSIIFHYFGLYHVTCGQPFDLPCSCIDGGVNLKVRGLTGTWKGCRHRNAKIWGKKGRFCENLAKTGGGLQPPSPPGSAAHVMWHDAVSSIGSVWSLIYVSVNSKPDHPPGQNPRTIFLIGGEFPTPGKNEFKPLPPPLGPIKTS